MKTTTTLALSLLLLVGASAQAASEKISVAQAPLPVRESLAKSESQFGPVKQITRRTVDGTTYYDVVFERDNSLNPRVSYREDGSVSRAPGSDVDTIGQPILVAEGMVMSAPVIPDIKLEDLPATVQATARREAGGRNIADIDEETWEGRRVYEIEFADAGLNPQIHVATDGTVLRGEEARKSLKSIFMGTQLADTPPAVQAAIKRTLGDVTITDIDREGPANVFEVETRDSSGVRRVRFSEKGELLSDSHGRK